LHSKLARVAHEPVGEKRSALDVRSHRVERAPFLVNVATSQEPIRAQRGTLNGSPSRSAAANARVNSDEPRELAHTGLNGQLR
jgi:hypothetical protein